MSRSTGTSKPNGSEREAAATDPGVADPQATDPQSADPQATGEDPDRRDRLVASLWPWREEGTDADVEVIVYVVTGDHGGLRIPESFCRECHLFTHAADVAAARVDADVRVSVRSWWTHLPFALRHGGYHAPVMVVGGTRLSQGYDVPTPEDVVAAIEGAVE